LQNMTFADADSKRATLTKVREEIDPLKAHKLMDDILAPMYQLFAVYASGDISRAMHGQQWFITMQRRLDACRYSFDKALHAAEERLPEELVKARTVPVPSQDEGSCCICLVALRDSDDDDDDDDVPFHSVSASQDSHSAAMPASSSADMKCKLVLDCLHELHVHCGVKWLHSNNTCPLCRAKVGTRRDQPT